MNLLVTRFFGDDNIFWGEIPQMPGAHTWGLDEEDFCANAKESANLWLEDIIDGTSSHLDLYPPGMDCVRDYYLTENDSLTAIRNLASAVEKEIFPDDIESEDGEESEDLLTLAAKGIIELSQKDVDAINAHRVLVSI